MPKYYPINEETARRAKNANSFSDYVPGSATAAYHEMVDRAYALGEQQKGRVDPMYHEKIDGLIDRYARKLAENINQSNLIDARVPSILIAGGSNFPVRKKEKQNAARDKNMGEYMQIEGLLIQQRMAEAGIRNMGAYMRKMALNGYVLHVDLSPVRELVSLQRRCSNNLNQVAIQANTYGGIYPEEIAALQRDYAALWGPLSDLLKKLSALVEL